MDHRRVKWIRNAFEIVGGGCKDEGQGMTCSVVAAVVVVVHTLIVEL